MGRPPEAIFREGLCRSRSMISRKVSSVFLGRCSIHTTPSRGNSRRCSYRWLAGRNLEAGIQRRMARGARLSSMISPLAPVIHREDSPATPSTKWMQLAVGGKLPGHPVLGFVVKFTDQGMAGVIVEKAGSPRPDQLGIPRVGPFDGQRVRKPADHQTLQLGFLPIANRRFMRGKVFPRGIDPMTRWISRITSSRMMIFLPSRTSWMSGSRGDERDGRALIS